MQKIVLLFCILINFWGVYTLEALGLFSYTTYVFQPNAYFDESIKELFWISLIMILVSILLFKKDKNNGWYREPYSYSIRYVLILKIIYYVLLAIFISKFSLDNTTRGVGQFDVSSRSGLSGLIAGISPIAIAFMLFLAYTKPFAHNNRYLVTFILIMGLSGLSSGGRRNIVYIAITLVLFLTYVQNMQIKRMVPVFAIIVPLLLGFSILARSGSILSIGNYDGEKIVEYSTASIMQTNSDPSFLWGIKEFEDRGITMTPRDFLHHFTSILMPSFVYSKLTGRLSSYNRSVYLFDYWFSDKADQGWDFMTLADFYWCFGKLGYLLYLLVFCAVLYYFKKYISSGKVYLSASSILAILFFCQQRNDFGAILKPFIYTFIFLYVLEKVFVQDSIIIQDVVDGNMSNNENTSN